VPTALLAGLVLEREERLLQDFLLMFQRRAYVPVAFETMVQRLL
jgi:hypothetical protein|tara:strand:- start:544 stop:675 length:132 start_codon:yes stop_codon:yes gene_type:complete